MIDADFQSVLVPYDFGEAAARAYGVVREVADAGQRICVLHVLPDVNSFAINLVASAVHAHEAMKKAKELMREQLDVDQRTELHIRFGDPGSEIVTFAEDLTDCLIVIPAKSHSRFEHLLLGSVTERTLRLSKHPVLVLPAK